MRHKPNRAASSSYINGREEAQHSPATQVLFIHPAYPNQFTAIAAALNQDAHYQCWGLVHEMAKPQPANINGVPYFGFVPDGAVGEQTYALTNTFEAGLRNARGILDTLLKLQPTHRFDLVIGYAGFGASLILKSLFDCAVVSYSELPGFQSAAARSMFPLTVEQALSEQAFTALTYASMLQADLGVVPSQHTKNLFPPELQSKIRVQMEGFDTDHLPSGGAAQRAALGWPADRPMVGFFSRTLEAVRGFDIFLQIAKRLQELDPTIQFVVIGDETTLYGNEAIYLNGQSFKQFALAQVGIPPGLFYWYPSMPYDQFRQHIACLDLAILPLFEGAANWSLFEAMAMGLPILASNRCYIPEVIRNGLDGLLIGPDQIDAFVEQALALLRDRRRARLLGRSAQARIRRHFSVAQAAKGYKAIIQEAIARHRAGRSALIERNGHRSSEPALLESLTKPG